MSKIEEVARAIYDQFPYDGELPVKPAWVERGNSLKQGEARRMARAAIEAMREPTEGMTTAGNGPSFGEGFLPDIELIERFQAMIDAALEE